MTDSRGVILEANHAASALFKCPKEFLIDKPLGLLIRDRHHAGFLRMPHGLGGVPAALPSSTARWGAVRISATSKRGRA